MASDIKDTWITDSGASCYDLLTRVIDKSVEGEMVSLGNDKQCNVSGKETVLIKRFINGHWEEGKIEEVLFVLQIKRNLFSVGACTRKGFHVSFNEQRVVLKRDNKIQAVDYRQPNDIYRLFEIVTNGQTSDKIANLTTSCKLGTKG